MQFSHSSPAELAAVHFKLTSTCPALAPTWTSLTGDLLSKLLSSHPSTRDYLLEPHLVEPQGEKHADLQKPAIFIPSIFDSSSATSSSLAKALPNPPSHLNNLLTTLSSVTEKYQISIHITVAPLIGQPSQSSFFHGIAVHELIHIFPLLKSTNDALFLETGGRGFGVANISGSLGKWAWEAEWVYYRMVYEIDGWHMKKCTL